MRQGAILVFGEALVDLVPGIADGPPEEILGGSGFNTALALARCGGRVALNASLSRDDRGRRFRARMAEEGIDGSLIGDCDAPTPTAAVEALDADGQASYRFTLSGTALDMAPPAPADLSGFTHLHVTSFGATIGASGEAAPALMARAREAGLSISYDLNIRPAVLPVMAETRRLVDERVALCDLVKLSLDDAMALFDGGWSGVYGRWFAQGVSSILQTNGGEGAELKHAGGATIYAMASAWNLVDTIGAGDAFMGAFLSSLASNGGLGAALCALPEEISASAMDFAAHVAAETCSVRGCDPPRRTPPEPND